MLARIAERIAGGKARLSGLVQGVLEELIFDNRYTFHPRRIAELGGEEVANLFAFLEGRLDAAAVRRLGEERAQEGLAVGSLLAVGTLLRRFLLEEGEELSPLSADERRAALAAADEYLNAYLGGLLRAERAQILQDQEQLRMALSDALEQQRRELFIKNYAIHTSINGIIITDLEGLITYVNPSFLRMWGYGKPEDLRGTRSAVFFGEERSRQLYEAPHRTEGWHAESVVRRLDGTTAAAEVSASLIRDDSGAPIGVMASFVDITERKRLESQFRQAQKMDALGHLASGIVHDVNNLLTAISGYAQLELLGLPPDGPIRHSLSQIKIATDRGKGLTQQLRVFTRQASGEKRPVDLNQLVEETYELIRRTFPPNVNIVLNMEPGLGKVNADPSQMSQLLMNLCMNARDAMGDGGSGGREPGGPGTGGRLSVVTSNVRLNSQAASRFLTAKAGDYVCVKVSDTGVGMPPEVLERLFEPFFTTKDVGKGTGLGLAVVYGIVQNHQGFIDVKSAPGAGSVFEVYLPMSLERPAEEPPPGEDPDTLVYGTGTVLVVEDEAQVRGMVEHTLTRCGYKVSTAENGLEALALYEERREPFDLVVLDMIMPKMNGWDCYHRLKALDPDVRVLIMTGYTADGSPGQLLKDGVAAFVEKPLNLQAFTRAVHEAIRR